MTGNCFVSPHPPPKRFVSDQLRDSSEFGTPFDKGIQELRLTDMNGKEDTRGEHNVAVVPGTRQAKASVKQVDALTSYRGARWSYGSREECRDRKEYCQ